MMKKFSVCLTETPDAGSDWIGQVEVAAMNKGLALRIAQSMFNGTGLHVRVHPTKDVQDILFGPYSEENES